ncbi:MAG: hypothetical protein KGN79_09855 [Acidobacteriota bacterium]|nr:hypothetical protein [Acidobacteriota bacterium]
MRFNFCLILIAVAAGLLPATHSATPHKVHAVALGHFRTVPYSKTGDPAGALPDEDSLKIRPLVVDGRIKEWTTGEVHDITDRTFVVRRVVRINDDLPENSTSGKVAERDRWVWQRGPWLLIEKTSGRVTPVKLPDFDTAVSHVIWFRDYAAYCGVTRSGKSLYAVVAQLTIRKPVLSRKLSSFDAENLPACSDPQWQRKPLQITFFPTGKPPVSFQFIPGSTALIEDSGDEVEGEQTARTGAQPETRADAPAKP